MREVSAPGASLLLVVFFAVVAAALEFEAFDFDKLSGANVGALFLTAIFTALVIERAVEVFVNTRFGAEEAKLKRPLLELSRDLTRLNEAKDAEMSRYVDPTAAGDAARAARDDRIDTLRERSDATRLRLNDMEREQSPALSELQLKKQRSAAAMAMLLGGAAAGVGVRVLEGLTSAELRGDGGLDDFQLALFAFVDVVLTALLLAGGADGIHQ
ncbi:MAG: hypothetical protein AAFU61_11050, partial [Pseudomonadota bacterium]